MSKAPDETDLELFREAIEGTEPLAADRPEPFRRRPAPVPITQPAHLQEREALAAISEAEVECQEYLAFSRPGVQKRTFADLQRGYFEIGLELDLHGLTVAHAKRALDEFLDACAGRRVRCACIIHGKGYRSGEQQPVIKRKVNYWLRLRDEVLAFCSATRRDGGSGAVYVLLRNPEKARRERARRR
jgi:DNA-nicking Smr family endonuclease